jgi:prepilin signal peptidase PulO-like enzyme (type II secretory pathway)
LFFLEGYIKLALQETGLECSNRVAQNMPVGWYWVVLVFLAAVGGVIGSFLNVVIYRLPAGRSIIWPGSHCPGCGHPIRWYDNLPVLSWFLLRGRCRDCRMRISWRYPAVEAVTMGLFVVLGCWELMGGGHLPNRPLRLGSTILWAPYTRQELAALYAYHLMLCCTLLAAGLIEHDHPRIGGGVWVRLFWPTWVWGLAAPVIWPAVHPVPAFCAGPGGWPGRLLGLLDAVVGLAGGIAVGFFWTLLEAGCTRSAGKQFRNPGFWMPKLGAAGLVGMYLGWQAGLVVGLGSGLLWSLSSLVSRGLARPPADASQTQRFSPIPFSFWLGLASFLWILFWNRWIDWSKRLF